MHDNRLPLLTFAMAYARSDVIGLKDIHFERRRNTRENEKKENILPNGIYFFATSVVHCVSLFITVATKHILLKINKTQWNTFHLRFAFHAFYKLLLPFFNSKCSLSFHRKQTRAAQYYYVQ